MVIAAKIRGTSVEHLVEQKDTKEGIQLHKSAVREVQEKVGVGVGAKIGNSRPACARLLVFKNVKRCGIDISSISTVCLDQKEE